MKPILLDITVPIETKRLLLRNPIPGDGKALNEAVSESFESLKEWMPWAQSKPSVEETEEHVRRAFAAWILREDLQFLIVEKSSNVIVGSAGLHRMDWNIGKFEIGYWVRTPYAGQGFISEAVVALIELAFQSFAAKRVEIRCDAKNAKSANLAKRLGFSLEGTLRKDAKSATSLELRDTLIFSRVDLEGIS